MNFILFGELFFIGSLIWLSYEDISSMSVSIYGVMLFVLSIVFQYSKFNFTSFFVSSFLMILIFFSLYIFGKFFTNKDSKKLMGFIDVFILIGVSSVVSYEEIPNFIVFCGIFSLTTHVIYIYLKKGEKAPFIPSIFFSYLLTSFKYM